jgi:glycerol kinase
MSATNLYLALDQGGHASRAILFDAQGQALAQVHVPVATRRGAADTVEHDPAEIVDSLKAATNKLLEQHRPAEVTAAGLATQRSSIVCWNRVTGAALSPVISWQDRRNAALVERLRPHAGRIHAITGLVLSPHYGASKLRWCLDHIPAVRDAARSGELAFGPLSSFILHQLLVERPFVVDPANASRTQLWSPQTHDWSPELLAWFVIPAQHLPESVASQHAYGTLEAGGLRIPLTVCTGDQAAVPFAFGPAQPDTAYINAGTGAFILRPLDRPVIAPPLLSSILVSDEQTITCALEGTVNGAGSALEWLAQSEGVDTKALLPALPVTLDASVKPPLFLNGVSGLGSPFWIADFQSRFEGDGSPQELLIAVLESVLFLVRVNLDGMRAHGLPLENLVATGGIAASDFVCQSLADLTGLKVTRYEEREATARGLAFLMAGQPAGWPAPPSQVFQPRLNSSLRERFFAWLKLMKQARQGLL